MHLNDFFTLLDLTTDNSRMHITELATMAFIEHQNNMLIPDRMRRVLLDEYVQFLNRRYDDTGSGILKLLLEDSSAFVAVCCTFLKSIVFLDGLIVQVLAVNNKQNLINIGQIRSKLRRLEGGKGLTTTGGMPNVAACINRTGLLGVGRCLYSGQNTLGCNDLIGPHHKQ